MLLKKARASISNYYTLSMQDRLQLSAAALRIIWVYALNAILAKGYLGSISKTIHPFDDAFPNCSSLFYSGCLYVLWVPAGVVLYRAIPVTPGNRFFDWCGIAYMLSCISSKLSC